MWARLSEVCDVTLFVAGKSKLLFMPQLRFYSRSLFRILNYSKLQPNLSLNFFYRRVQRPLLLPFLLLFLDLRQMRPSGRVLAEVLLAFYLLLFDSRSLFCIILNHSKLQPNLSLNFCYRRVQRPLFEIPWAFRTLGTLATWLLQCNFFVPFLN
jgi:hypothetical protein